jgi:hypothetical protein
MGKTYKDQKFDREVSEKFVRIANMRKNRKISQKQKEYRKMREPRGEQEFIFDK